MRCPECMRQRTRVTHGAAAFGGSVHAPATFALIAINAAVFLVQIGTGHGVIENASPLIPEFGLFGPLVAEGEWYRLFTSAFIHAGLPHIGLNMLMLYFLGQMLEPAIGTPRFVVIYLTSLFAGSFGALLLTPYSLSFGASGAIFGVLGAAFVVARGRRLHSLASSIGVLILINLAFSLGVAGISLGAHLGGLVAGVACALVILAGERGMLGRRSQPAELVLMIAIGVIFFAAAMAIA